ncbi:YceI family protein [Amycolatopsis aidingensis]|uniref:YceI family protein n=1 Tax=Amycolatopsis aidingensis TaxID=2842453 RepID=UPI001E655253|nr:YceI family protein [Amycolatopsis aidingensis]
MDERTYLMNDPKIEIPAVGDYRIDPERSAVSFTTRHIFGLAAVRGTFRLREGQIHVADPVSGSTVRASIAAGSFDTGLSARDVTVRSAQYLDTEKHPDITFAADRAERVEGRWVLPGSLTVLGRAREIQVPVEEVRQEGSLLRARASARVDRYEFGITAMKGMTGRYLDLRLEIIAGRAG